MARRAGPALLVSLGAHALFLAGFLAFARHTAPLEPSPPARSIAPAVLARAAAALAAARRTGERTSARAALVASARADRAAGHLALGPFLLEASRIDAEEAGIELDVALARERYAARVAALKVELAKKKTVKGAAPAVFVDLKYYGKPGGLMASALVDGGGSCEQVAQVVAAAVFAAGRPAEIALRYYGGLMDDGVSHITPIAVERAEEHDLMTGAPAHLGGVRIEAPDLIEIYARAHGLAPKLPDPSGASAGRSAGTGAGAGAGASGPSGARDTPPPLPREGPSTERRPTLIAGLPPNADRYPGALPLYAARAVRDPSRGDAALAADAESIDLQAKHCAYFLRIAMLAPPSIDVVSEDGASGFAVEPRRVPVPLKLEREAMLLRAAEIVATQPATEPVDRLMAWACLAVLGETAAVDFALAREPALARDAVRAQQRGRREGKAALAAITWTGAEGDTAAKKLAVDYAGRSWVLLALDGGDRVVMDLVTREGREDWGRISALGALVVWPGTRAKAVEVVSKRSLSDQVAVMHEVFHAHDHMRPWASTFELDGTAAQGASAAQFLTAYRVFRGLAWRLWEAQRPVEESLAALEGEARALGVDRAWEATLLDYFAINALGLFSQRPGGIRIVPLLRAAAEKNPHASLDSLRRRLAYLAEQTELDARSVADAMRIP